MTRDEFENLYECPWTVNNISLEDCPCIFNLYRELQMATKTRDELIETAKLFGCFSLGAMTPLKTVSDERLERVRVIWSQGRDAIITDDELKELGSIVLPPVMVQAALISRKFGLPEFYAGLQYIRANYPFEDKKNASE